MVERDLAKVDVAGSTPVSRSKSHSLHGGTSRLLGGWAVTVCLPRRERPVDRAARRGRHLDDKDASETINAD